MGLFVDKVKWRFWQDGEAAICFVLLASVAQWSCFFLLPLGQSTFYFGLLYIYFGWFPIVALFPVNLLIAVWTELMARRQSDAACRRRYRFARVIAQVCAISIVLIQANV